MLIISKRQMSALDDYYLGRYTESNKKKYADSLFDELPELFQYDVFKEWIREARNFGIVTQDDSDWFIELHLQHSAMRERPWNEEFKYILTHGSLEAPRKLILLSEKNAALENE
ncbi:MAG: hypothetical protein LC670_05505 [Flavobacteriales bacterium]|nr:hypothetical protein [Flavobacteriales bacterium]